MESEHCWNAERPLLHHEILLVLIVHPPLQQLCSEQNNYDRGFGCQGKKLKPAPKPAEAQPRSRSSTLGNAWIFFPHLNKMSKMYLMRSSPLTNEAVICQKGKSAVNLVRAHPLTPCQHALRFISEWGWAGRCAARGWTAIYSDLGELRIKVLSWGFSSSPPLLSVGFGGVFQTKNTRDAPGKGRMPGMWGHVPQC